MPKAADRDTREEIIELAREITQTRSFNWLSYQDLSERLNIRKASIHYHFPTKADLGAELLRDYRAQFAEWAEKMKSRSKPLSAGERLDAYFELFRKISARTERVCPIGVFSVEWHTLPDEMKSEARRFLGDHRRWLEEVLREGRKSGEIRDIGSVEDQIALIGASVQGALQIARVVGNANVFSSALRQIRAVLMVD